VAVAHVAIQMAALLVRNASQKAADERWADPSLREQDDFQERLRAGIE
jgi:hypothetical protein